MYIDVYFPYWKLSCCLENSNYLQSALNRHKQIRYIFQIQIENNNKTKQIAKWGRTITTIPTKMLLHASMWLWHNLCVCVCDCGCVYARMSNEPSSLLLLTNAPFPLVHSLNTAGHLWNLGTLEYVLLTLASVT